jgi:hypothetical protein
MYWMSSNFFEFLCFGSLLYFPSPEFLLQIGEDEGHGRLVVAVGDYLRFGDIKSQQFNQQTSYTAGNRR